jgi:DNA-binding CsgD family transcriptional regulator
VSPVPWCAICTSLRLSRREQQIAEGILEDLKEVAIARRLGMSLSTVKTHTERMYRKLDVASRPGLIRQLWFAHVALLAQGGPTWRNCPFRDDPRCPSDQGHGDPAVASAVQPSAE